MTQIGTMIMVLFSVFLAIITFITFRKNKYLNVFIPCLLFLPSYYGVEINSSLPVLSVSRMMYIVFFIYVIIFRRKAISINIGNLKYISKEYYLLVLYFLLKILSNLYYINESSASIKAIAMIIFESVFLIYGTYLLAPTKEEMLGILKAVVNVSSVLFVFGILESLTSIRIFDCLYTVNREIMNDHYVRLGLLRATTTMSIPNYFGNVCLLVFPLICYLKMVTQQKRYLFFAIVNILALIHVGSRSTILFYIFILILYCIFTILEGNHVKSTFKSIFIVAVVVCTWILLASFLSDKAEYFYTGTGKSLLNVVGFDFDLNRNAPENSGGFGKNEGNATYSRTYQLSGAKLALETNPLFGLGAGCVEEGKLIYSWHGEKVVSKSVDSAVVELIIYEGLLGVVAFIFLYIFFLMVLNKRRLHCVDKNISRTMLLVLISYTISLSVTTNMPRVLAVIIIFFMYENGLSEGQ